MSQSADFRGVALLQRGAEPVVAVAGGATRSDADAQCTLDTRFQIASVSKQFTAAAVLTLADRGILPLDDPVGKWLAARARGNAGYLAANCWFPDDDLRLVILTNDETTSIEAILGRLTAAAFGTGSERT